MNCNSRFSLIVQEGIMPPSCCIHYSMKSEQVRVSFITIFFAEWISCYSFCEEWIMRLCLWKVYVLLLHSWRGKEREEKESKPCGWQRCCCPRCWHSTCEYSVLINQYSTARILYYTILYCIVLYGAVLYDRLIDRKRQSYWSEATIYTSKKWCQSYCVNKNEVLRTKIN